MLEDDVICLDDDDGEDVEEQDDEAVEKDNYVAETPKSGSKKCANLKPTPPKVEPPPKFRVPKAPKLQIGGDLRVEEAVQKSTANPCGRLRMRVKKAVAKEKQQAKEEKEAAKVEKQTAKEQAKVEKEAAKARVAVAQRKASSILPEPWWHARITSLRMIEARKGNVRAYLTGTTHKNPKHRLVLEVSQRQHPDYLEIVQKMKDTIEKRKLNKIQARSIVQKYIHGAQDAS